MKKEIVVHVTSDWYRDILTEKERHPKTECACQMPGMRKENEFRKDFYFDRAADSGINASYSYVQVEKDHTYTDHLCNRILELYEVEKGRETCSIIHWHPPGCNEFSSVDMISNRYLAQKYGGIVAGLMWTDPEFHLKFWYINEEGEVYPAKTILDDEGVEKAMPKRSIEGLINQVQENEYPEKMLRNGRKRIFNYFRFNETENLAKDENIMEAFPQIKEEFEKIGEDVDIRVTRRPDGTWLFSVKKHFKPPCYFSVKKEQGEVWLFTERCFIPYEMGLIEKLLDTNDIEELLPMDFLIERSSMYQIYMPEKMRREHYTGPLYGYYHSETKSFNVVSNAYMKQVKNTALIGYIKDEKDIDVYDVPKEQFLCGVWFEKEGGKELEISIGKSCNDADVDWISFTGEAFSRNGTLVSNIEMKECEVNILGVGSVGSYIALECARLGIGRINLFDDDILQYHNISRHQCGICDVGRFKVEAVKEKILNINPYCEVNAFPSMIQYMDPEKLEEVIHEKSVFICGTDNRHAAYVCNRLSDRFHIPMVTAGCGVRASTGEIFYYKPNCNMITYEEAFGEDKGMDYTNQQVRRVFYASESDLEKMTFQPGLYLDITLTSILAAKLSVDLLMEGAENYEPKLLPYMKQGILVINHPTDEEQNPLMKAFRNQKDGIRPLQWINVIGNRNGGQSGRVQDNQRETSLLECGYPNMELR